MDKLSEWIFQVQTSEVGLLLAERCCEAGRSRLRVWCWKSTAVEHEAFPYRQNSEGLTFVPLRRTTPATATSVSSY